MTKKEAYKAGYEIGFDIAEAQAPELIEELGGFPQRPSLATTQELAREIAGFAAQHENEIYRQYSPFEFFAREINESSDPDGLWEAYEEGVHKGAMTAAKEFLKKRR
jgi:hypothetical protein